jgi:FlaA1/EpsC-like NDP-sugar epimerase
MGSRGSVIPYFIKTATTGELPITDPRMTRFMITLDQGVKLVWYAFNDMLGAEIYVKKIPSMVITDIAKAVSSSASHKVIGIRPGEKIHEQMIGKEDAEYTYEYENHYKILPSIYNWAFDPKRIKDGKKVAQDFQYDSGTNTDWMSVEDLQNWIRNNRENLKT